MKTDGGAKKSEQAVRFINHAGYPCVRDVYEKESEYSDSNRWI